MQAQDEHEGVNTDKHHFQLFYVADRKPQKIQEEHGQHGTKEGKKIRKHKRQEKFFVCRNHHINPDKNCSLLLNNETEASVTQALPFFFI